MGEIRSTSKTGGQKGVKLARFDLIPQGALYELAEHYGVGASKYDDHQWRVGYEWSKSYSALCRHLSDFWAGKDYDVCSNDPGGCSYVDANGEPFSPVRADACFNHTGSHHMVAVMWHASVLLEFKDHHPDFDDRYILDKLANFDLQHNKIALSELDEDKIDIAIDGVTVNGEVVCTCLTRTLSIDMLKRDIEHIKKHLSYYHNIRK